MEQKKIGFKESRISPELYFEWRKNRVRKCVNWINYYCDLTEKKVLDFGCGYGALSASLLEKKAHVWGTEINKDKLVVAQNKLSHEKHLNLQLTKNEKLDFEDNFFDVIFIFDVIEHVKDPKKAISECFRTLKKGGLLYVEFTPYYSVTGHHLYDYAKWPIHILPREKIKKLIFSKKVDSFMTPEYYWDQFESLNKLRIGDFQKMASPFIKIKERFIIKYPEKFEINIPLINFLGPFKDYFTMSFEGLYRK